MTLADRITFSRIVLAPVFFLLYFIPVWFGTAILPTTIFLWILFTVIELSDLFDGRAARGLNQVRPFGKLFDPFADVIARLTYFICFAFSGIMPVWALLIIFYREFGQLFLRLLMLQKGIAMGARKGGKLKAVVYMLAGLSSLALVTMTRLGLFASLHDPVWIATQGLYILSVAFAVLSFVDYFIQFRKA
jgi:CDP-diacylglycerol---glycerol-3-phosphate 3-phosphatidyltransferase